jgi:hypothetical protein
MADDSHTDLLLIRFSEYDLIMHYHWGLAIGHIHVHRPTGPPSHNQEEPDIQDDHSPGHKDVVGINESNVNTEAQDENSGVCDSDDLKLGFEDHEHEGWDDVELEGEDGLEGVNLEAEEDT